MASTQDFADYILDCIDDETAAVRKMFGEFALYYNKKTVAFICDNTLFLKITPNSTEILKKENINLKKGPAYPGSKDYFIGTEELMENKKVFRKVLEGIWEDVPVKIVKKKLANKK